MCVCVCVCVCVFLSKPVNINAAIDFNFFITYYSITHFYPHVYVYIKLFF